VRSSIVARNYADVLLELARRHGGDETVDAFADALGTVAGLLREDARIGEFLATPRVDPAAKKAALRQALQGRAPELFVRFIEVVVEKRRAALLGAIASEFEALVDQVRGRVRAEVTLAREPDQALRTEISSSLERMLSRQVVAEFRVDADLLGGIVVRVGDQVLDGSIRQRSSRLRHRLLAARMTPTVTTAG
jgi:F-type H+-transporting ATPase subunit delta